MHATHILKNIPPDIQALYNIAEKVVVEADNGGVGGNFTLQTRDGSTVSVDAAKLAGTRITIDSIDSIE
jgi:hypothetical protein